MKRAPYLSVIVPAYQAADQLPKSMEALLASDLASDRWELIVVDDGSQDATVAVARTYADTVIHLEAPPHGPSYARNRGSELARGDVLVFIDADVCIHPDALGRIAEQFDRDPTLGAVFGAYDDAPPAPGIASKYRNLLHHWVHCQNPGPAETFWAGCGAIRTTVFRDVGMFNEWHFTQAQIEDVELGYRMRDAGHTILLDPDIQATHLKRWSLRQMVKTDIKNRGVPWTRLLMRRGPARTIHSLNLKWSEKVLTICATLMVLLLLTAALGRVWWLAGLAGVCVLPIMAANRSLYTLFLRRGGLWFALAAIPLHIGYYVLNALAAVGGWLLHHAFGDPQPSPTVEALAELGAQTWPPVPKKVPESAAPPPIDRPTMRPRMFSGARNRLPKRPA